MGLIKAGTAALGTVLSDQWREYFYCEAMGENVLVRKGQKRTSDRSSNTKASDNVISNGSVIAVNEGQAMMIVDQGAIVEFSAEAGEYTWDSSTEPSIFYGGLGQGIKKSWETLKKRFTFGGDTAKDQRVYFFNTLEIMNNKYGTANPVPFRVVDDNINLKLDVGLKCFGTYSYRITDPLAFYKNVCGNVSADFTRDKLDNQLKTEILTVLQPAFARISEMGIIYSAIPGHTVELSNALNEELTKYWAEKNRGISISSFGVTSITANEEDEKRIKDLQTSAALRDPSLAYGTMASATAAAMRAAAENEHAGAAMGFMNMNMAGNMGMNTMAGMFPGGAPVQNASASANSWTCTCGTVNTGNFCSGCGAKKPDAPGTWTCACGASNTGNFCSSCGAKKPEIASGWTCSCGAVNTGKFCSSCGAEKPATKPVYKCNKCGWVPDDPTIPPKFCPECGDVFNDSDIG